VGDGQRLFLDVLGARHLPHDALQDCGGHFRAHPVVLHDHRQAGGVGHSLEVGHQGVRIVDTRHIGGHGDHRIRADLSGPAREHGRMLRTQPLHAEHHGQAPGGDARHVLEAQQALLIGKRAKATGVHRPHQPVRAAANAKLDDALQAGPIHLAVLREWRGRYRKDAAIRCSHAHPLR